MQIYTKTIGFPRDVETKDAQHESGFCGDRNQFRFYLSKSAEAYKANLTCERNYLEGRLSMLGEFRVVQIRF